MTGEKPRDLRLFVAIELPEAWLKGLGDLQKRMQAAIAGDAMTAGVRMRWVRPEVMHLTLKFIGEVSPDRLEPIREQILRAVPAKPNLTLSLAGVGSFADRRAPRVVWAGIRSEPEPALRQLAESIETWLAAAGVARERRGFQPHLTLARLPDRLSEQERQRAALVTTAVPAPELPRFEVDHVHLIQSFLGPGGPRYEHQGRWPS